MYRDNVFVMGGESRYVSNTNIFELAGDQWVTVPSLDFAEMFSPPLCYLVMMLHCGVNHK